MKSIPVEHNDSARAKEFTYIYGGSFDPPHIGHIAFVTALANEIRSTEVWVLPSYRHPFGKEMEPFQHRLEMCRIAFSEISPKIKIKNDEERIGGNGYTIDLVRYLTNIYEHKSFVLALGADNYGVRHQWKDFDEIEKLISIEFFGRKGWKSENSALGLDTPFPEVCSKDLRQNLQNGIVDEKSLTTQIVSYIKQNRLYSSD